MPRWAWTRPPGVPADDAAGTDLISASSMYGTLWAQPERDIIGHPCDLDVFLFPRFLCCHACYHILLMRVSLFSGWIPLTIKTRRVLVLRCQILRVHSVAFAYSKETRRSDRVSSYCLLDLEGLTRKSIISSYV